MPRSVVYGFFALLASCSGIRADIPEGVFEGQVSAGTSAEGGTDSRVVVRGLDLDTESIGVLSPDGTFSVPSPAPYDDYVISVAGSSYVDPLTGARVSWGPNDAWTRLEPVVEGGRQGILVSPLTDLVSTLAQCTSSNASNYNRALLDAAAELLGLWGCALPTNVAGLMQAKPANLRVPGAPTALTPDVYHSMVIGAMSCQSVLLNEILGVAPNTRVTLLDILRLYRRELSDCRFDGMGSGGEILSLQGLEVGADGLRSNDWGFIKGLRCFLDDPEANQTGITSADVGDWFQCLANYDSPLLTINTAEANPPHVQIDTPTETSVRGTVSVTCSAADENEIASLDVAVLRDGTPVDGSRLSGAFTQLNGTDANAGVTLATQNAPDGVVEIQCRARDKFDNQGDAKRQVLIDNVVGAIEVSIPSRLGNMVEGDVVELRCICQDPESTCTLVTPSPDAPNLECGATPDHCFWDTTQELDGNYTVSCRGTSEGLDPSTEEALVVVQNLKPVRYRGSAAFADSPIVVRPLGSDEVVAVGTADSNGNFDITVDANPGLLVFEFGGEEATYFNTVADRGISVGNSRLWLAWDHVPASAPREVAGLSAHLMTTVAAKTCEEWAKDEATSQARFDVCRLAHDLWSQHYFTGEIVELRTLPWRRYDAAIASASRHLQIVSMAHAELDYFGAWMATADSRLPASYGWARMLGFLLRDLDDGVVDGFENPEDRSLRITDGYALHVDSFRHDLMQRRAQFLRGIALPDRSVVPNPAGFTPSDWASETQYAAQNDSRIFGEEPGKRVDLEPAELTPAAELPSALDETHELCINVTDASRITDWGIVGPVAVTNVRLENGQLCGTLDTRAVSDGPLLQPITYFVVDENGNRAEGTLSDVEVNKAGPSVVAISPDLGTRLTGTVDLKFRVEDIHGVASFMLLEPAAVPIEGMPVGNDEFVITFPSSYASEGAVDLLLEAVDGLGRVHQVSLGYEADNADDGFIRGCAQMETPVVGGVVSACTVNDQGGCLDTVDILSIRGDDGCFELEVPETVEGFVRISVAGGAFTDGFEGYPVVLSDGDFSGLTRVVYYRAQKPSLEVENVAVGIETTVADAWAMRRLVSAKEANYPTAIANAYDLFTAHFGFDITTTYARDFLTDSDHATRVSEASTRRALVGMGFATCAAEIAITNNNVSAALSSVDALQAMLNDIESDIDSYFDGWVDKDAGTAVTLLDDTLDSHFLRGDLAQCIAHWLLSGMNPTSGEERLTPASFSQPGGFLQQLTVNPEVLLFGPRAEGEAPPIFDRAAPELVELYFERPAESEGKPISGELSLRIKAFDPSGFVLANTVRVELVGAEPGVQQRAIGANSLDAPGRRDQTYTALFPIRSVEIEDRTAWTFRVYVTDSVGNVGTQEITVAVDNTAPLVSLTSADNLVGDPPGDPLPTASVVGRVSDSVGPHIKLELFVDGALRKTIDRLPQDSESGEWLFAEAVAFNVCDAVKRVEIRATDVAGNQGFFTKSIECDGTPPGTTYGETQYNRRDRIDVSRDANRLVFTNLENSDARLREGWNSSQIPVIHKDLSRLDEWSDNSVVININVSDSTESGNVFTPPSQLMARYQVWEEPVESVPTLKRDWTDISAVVSGAVAYYSIPISYQTLHADLWKTRPGTVHRITLRVWDKAGNTTEQHTRFKLRVYSPPVFVSNCRYYPEELDRFSLGTTRLEDIFFGSVNPRISSCDVTYLLNVRPDSLAPRMPVRVDTVQSMPTDWSIETRVAFGTWPWSQRTRGLHMHCFPQPWPPVRNVTYYKGPWHYFHKTWAGGACEDGLVLPSSNPDINGPRTRSPDPDEDRVEDYTISWDPQLDRYSNVSDQNGQVVNPLGGSYGIAPDNRHSVEYRLRSRGLLKNGEPISWSWKNYHSGHQLLHLGWMYRDDGTQAFYTEMRTRHFVDFSPPHDFLEFRTVSKWLYASKVTLRYGMSPLIAYHPELASEVQTVDVHHEGDCASSTMASFVTEKEI